MTVYCVALEVRLLVRAETEERAIELAKVHVAAAMEDADIPQAVTMMDSPSPGKH